MEKKTDHIQKTKASIRPFHFQAYKCYNTHQNTINKNRGQKQTKIAGQLAIAFQFDFGCKFHNMAYNLNHLHSNRTIPLIKQ